MFSLNLIYRLKLINWEKYISSLISTTERVLNNILFCKTIFKNKEFEELLVASSNCTKVGFITWVIESDKELNFSKIK